MSCPIYSLRQKPEYFGEAWFAVEFVALDVIGGDQVVIPDAGTGYGDGGGNDRHPVHLVESSEPTRVHTSFADRGSPWF